MAIPFNNPSAYNDTVYEDFLKDLETIFSEGQFTQGPAVQKFEETFARFTGVRQCVTTGSGSDALVMALRTLGVGPSDEVICPAFGFASTAEAVVRAGATPVFVDVRPDSYTLDPDKTLASLTSRTKAIIPVHIFGHAAEIDRITSIARTYSVSVIEDCRGAAGARLGNRRLGTYGEMSVFSFHPNSPLGGLGDGGAICTNSEPHATLLRKLRNHGRDPESATHEMIGYYSLLDTANAALLLHKLQDLDENNAENIENAGLYNRLFLGSPVIPPMHRDDGSYVYTSFAVQVPDREKLSAFLTEKGIGHAVFCTLPVHLQPAFAYLGGIEGAFPIAEELCAKTLMLPIMPGLKKHQVESVADAILEFYGVKI